MITKRIFNSLLVLKVTHCDPGSMNNGKWPNTTITREVIRPVLIRWTSKCKVRQFVELVTELCAGRTEETLIISAVNSFNQSSVQLDWLLLSGGNANRLYDAYNVVPKCDMLLNISVVWCSVFTSYFYLTLFSLFVFFFLSYCDMSNVVFCAPDFPMGTLTVH